MELTYSLCGDYLIPNLALKTRRSITSASMDGCDTPI